MAEDKSTQLSEEELDQIRDIIKNKDTFIAIAKMIKEGDLISVHDPELIKKLKEKGCIE